MKIGACASYVNWQAIADTGYDHIEGNLTELATVTDEKFGEIKKIASSLPIKVETTNCFSQAARSFTHITPMAHLTSKIQKNKGIDYRICHKGFF